MSAEGRCGASAGNVGLATGPLGRPVWFAAVEVALVLVVARDKGGNRPLVWLDGQRTRLELVGPVVVRVMWFVEVGARHGSGFRKRCGVSGRYGELARLAGPSGAE